MRQQLKRRQYRQGDVLICEAGIPAEAVKVPHSGRIVLAEGEATGHAHAIAVEADEDVALLERSDARFLEVKSPATLRHEEHAAITIAPGTYTVIRQREYAGEDEWIRVAD